MSVRLCSRRVALPVAVLAATIAAAVGGAAGSGSADAARKARSTSHYTVGLFGDMPYNAGGKADYPNLLADMNRHDLAFSAFDGDLKAGGDGPCDNALYTRSLSYFNLLRRPVVVTPGDNDWTDCWGLYGPATAPFSDPLERLQHERDVFFSTDQTLGRHTMTVARESAEGGPYAAYSENARWQLGPVVYLTLNVQGSNDNLPHAGLDGETRSDAEIARMAAEHADRLVANRHWLEESFGVAAAAGAKGVMVIWQADPNFNNERAFTDRRRDDGYPEIVEALRVSTAAFPGQVALVHGDSHVFKVDQPLKTADGHVLANFTRVETPGAADTHWVSAEVDATAEHLFTFRSQIVPENVH